jgi:hypothetical protein
MYYEIRGVGELFFIVWLPVRNRNSLPGWRQSS